MSKQFNPAAAALATFLALALSIPASAAEESTEIDKTPDQAEVADAEATEMHPSNEMKAVDAVAVRPVTFISSVFSAGTFLLALPFATFDPAMDVEKTRKNLVDYPFEDTFKRPLGDFNGSAW